MHSDKRIYRFLMHHDTSDLGSLIQTGMFQKECILIKQLLDEVEHDIMNYQNRGLCYLPKPKAEANNTDTRF